MSGLGEILAIISLTLQVVVSVEKVIAIFDRVQNAPDELNQFRGSLLRLSQHFAALEEMEEKESVAISTSDMHETNYTLELCQKMFDEYDAALHEPGVRNTAYRATWATRHSTKLIRYQAKIDRIYLQVLLPHWLLTLSLQNKGKAPEGSSSKTIPSKHDRKKSAVAMENISELEHGIAKLHKDNNRAQAEKTLQELDQIPRKCRTALGISVEDLYENLGLLDPPRKSVAELPFETAPTRLHLKIAPEETQKIDLERVHVMARDDNTRIILYQSADTSVKVTHIIPIGCIPWAPTKTSRTVSFLNKHTVTVIDDEGHHIYHIDPKYIFKDPDACWKFQNTIRERKHLGAFDAVEVTSYGDTLSYGQVIRFWRKSGSKMAVTMTFLETSTGDGCGHKELNLERYQQLPIFILPVLNLLRKPKESDIVELRSDLPRRNHRIKFKTITDAKDFVDFFFKVHPLNKEVFEPEQNQKPPAPPAESKQEPAGYIDYQSDLALRPSLNYGPSLASAPSNTPTLQDISLLHDQEPPVTSHLSLDSDYTFDWKDDFVVAEDMSIISKGDKRYNIPRKPIKRTEFEKDTT